MRWSACCAGLLLCALPAMAAPVADAAARRTPAPMAGAARTGVSVAADLLAPTVRDERPAAPVADGSESAGQLRLSVDGVTWWPSLHVPLFDPQRRWVPGDSQTVGFWAENHSSDAATLTVDFVGSDAASLLDRAGVTLGASVNGRSRVIDTDVPSRLATIDRLAGGQRVRVELTVAMSPQTGNAAQHTALDVQLLVRLTELAGAPGAGAPGGTGGGSGTGSPIPGTGAAVLSTLALGAALLASGAVLAAVRRSRRAD